ncbi:MAG: LLM class flavin-dependent oxidoreductase [Clostridia bacterium]|nr:LLM class flavin-dependent oxidoreductase [Clostridia bacterium]
MVRPRFGMLELPRTTQSAVAHAQLAESLGFDLVGVADSQSVYREVYATLAAVAVHTRRVRVGPTVTNPLTRHPAVTASAIATVDELAGGRAFLGIGSGDSAILNLGLRPARLAEMRGAVQTLQQLLAGKAVPWQGRTIHTQWVGRRVPVYMSAEGPKTLELAGEIADGVICGLGLTPDIVELSLHHLRVGAERAGRRLEDLDIWAMVRVNVGDRRDELLREIRMELASSAHHVFRSTLQGKNVPPEWAEHIRLVQQGYDTRHHEALGDSPNARLMEDPAFLDYMARRFAVLGTPEECVEQIGRIVQAGFRNLLFTGFVQDRERLIRTLGERVLPAFI